MPCFGTLEKSAALGEGEETKLDVLPKSDFTTQVNEIECLVYMRTQERLPFKGKTNLTGLWQSGIVHSTEILLTSQV